MKGMVLVTAVLIAACTFSYAQAGYLEYEMTYVPGYSAPRTTVTYSAPNAIAQKPMPELSVRRVNSPTARPRPAAAQERPQRLAYNVSAGQGGAYYGSGSYGTRGYSHGNVSTRPRYSQPRPAPRNYYPNYYVYGGYGGSYQSGYGSAGCAPGRA